ncbi:MAG: FHA domain-containing protein [Planctomycetota bacterium]
MLTLIQFNPDDTRKPQTFRLSVDQPHIIGRRQGDVKLADSRISRQHAEVSVQNGTWVIRDMSSSNGTWVNGERIEGLCELEEGDRLVIGRITLLVGHVDAQAPATTPADVGPASTPILGSSEAPISDSTPTIDEPQPLDLDEDLDHLDPDAELDLSSIDLDELTGDGGDAEAVKEEPSVEVAADDLLDLNDAADDSSDDDALDAGASSLAPALTAEVTDGATKEVEDLEEEEDEYAASVDFVTPTTRPESPLDGVETSPGDESKSEVESESEVEQAMAGVDEDDEAPPVVGLSLGMPAPDVPNEDDPVEAEDEVALDDAAPEAPQVQQDHAAHDHTGLDLDLDDDLSSINLNDELALDDDPADASPSVTAESDAPPPAEPEPVAAADEPREPDLVDSEEQQELELAWSGQQSSRLKGVLALAVFALVVGGGVWLTLFNGNDSSITGVTPGEGLQPTPSDNSIAKTTQTTPKLADTAPASPPVNTAQTAAPTPAVSDPTPIATKSDAFGQATTLSAPAPRTTPAAAVPANPTPAPMVERVEEPVTPADLPAEPEPTATEPELPTLAMIDPTPTPGVSASIVPDPLTGGAGPTADALRQIESNDEKQMEDVVTPAVVGPARRIVFVIDASGSMVDSMNQGALSWLEQRLDTLTDRDRFAVLFFRSGEVIEVPPAGLTLADSLSRERVLAWTDPDTGNVRPRGKSEPMNALQQAQQYDPTDIFILSDDKFGERGNSAAINVGDIEQLLGTGPAVVHTVQFFYPNPDNRTLQAIAQRLGGTYEFVEEPPFDLDPNSDIGLDLLGISR